MTFSVFFDEWVKQEFNKLLKNKRTYRHFDNRIRLSSSNEWLRAKLTPEEISKHAFYPLINAAIITPRYKKDIDGRRFKELKLRPIAYASHFDSLIYSYYAYGLGVYNGGQRAIQFGYNTQLFRKSLGQKISLISEVVGPFLR